MANKYSTISDLFTDIANAIRIKKKSTDLIAADTFPTEIQSLKTGFDYNNQDIATISDYQFYGCEDLKNVNCSNLTAIGNNSFENCANLETVKLYNDVVSIGENAFKGCSNSTIFCEVEDQPETWHENWNPDNCATIWGHCPHGEPVQTWSIGYGGIDPVTATLYNDIFDEGMYFLVISGNGKMANFYETSYTAPWKKEYAKTISSVAILNGVTNIGNYAFHQCSSLTSIIIPDSVTTIDASVFESCTALTNITIPNSVAYIGEQAFSYCNALTNITIPDNVTAIEEESFINCSSMITVIIGNGVTKIGSHAFNGCSALTNVTIPDSITIISECAFCNCKSLTSIIYTGTIAQWNSIAFENAWNTNTGNYTIHCTDGDIAKDGTILGGE